MLPIPTRRSVALLVALLLGTLAVACGGSSVPASDEPPASSAPAPPPAAPDASSGPRAAAAAVARALSERDFGALAEAVDPERGVRFSPYAHVDPEGDVTLSRDQLREVAAGGHLERTWGHHDGSGVPIELTFRQYVDRFVYDAPYLAEGKVAVDERQGSGNTSDNAAAVYPDATIVEYHVPGEGPESDGMDWSSLRLALREEGGRWYLVGVIHDQWTI
jgi:hypothetical protein